jgi:hypothetical protein
MAEPTLRFRCLEAIRASLAGLVEGLPADDPYSVQFSAVEHGPLGDFDNRRRYVAAVVPGNESKQTRYPLTDCTLPVTIEFRMTADRGDQRPAIEAERMLGEIQRRIGEDRTLGGLAIDVRETGNDVDLDTYADKAIEGAVFLEVRYRHATDDPRGTV